LGEQAAEFVLGDRALELVERRPIRPLRERGELLRGGEVREQDKSEGGADELHGGESGESLSLRVRNQ
jgi:hypothetical protein